MIEEGQRVLLRPFEDQPEQVGTVLGHEDRYPGMYIVEVDDAFRVDDADDGIREVPDDQLEAI